MDTTYEELDSLTEDIIRRNREREKLLSSSSNDVFSDLSSNQSQSSLKSDVLVNDNKTNIKLNESQTETSVDSTSKQLFENLSKLSPNRRRIPLNQRLNSMVRTYYTEEDSENLDFIDANEDIRINNDFIRSPTKTMRQTPTTPSKSPPKKRPLLNERLNQIARSYDTSDGFDSNEPKDFISSAENHLKDKISKNNSPLKKTIEKKSSKSELLCEDTKNEVKTPINGSPLKKAFVCDQNTNLSQNKKITENVSPVKKQMDDNLKEKLTHLGFQQQTEPSVRPKTIYNINNNKKETPVRKEINCGSTVSSVRKQFEKNISEPKVDTPEILPLKAKTDLFEKAILAENEAKSKQYSSRKRIGQKEIKSSVKTNDNLKFNNKSDPNVMTSDEIAIKRQKSCENMTQMNNNVAVNILLRRQQLEQKLFYSETTTETAYKKELELRNKEIESLKRPMKQMPETKVSEEIDFKPEIVIQNEDLNKKPKFFIEPNEDNELNESVDDETAEQTVCDAFEDIDKYSNDISDDRLTEEDINDNFNYEFYSQNSELKIMADKKVNIRESKSPSKNRLYPQLFPEPNELCAQTFETKEEMPPEKPPRVYQEEATSQTNTTPLRTISFYRRETQLKNTTPSIQRDDYKANADFTSNIMDLDLAQRNQKIHERIAELKDKVEETNRIAGQASQALNLCLERDEFKGSTERVEAEKVLLLSGQRRIAFLNEIQNLKKKLEDNTPETIQSKGVLTLSDFKLQIKGEFIINKAKGIQPEVHHLIGLIYNGGNVLSTNLLNSESDIKNGFMEFDFGFRDLNELSADFKIQVQIFDLITKKNQMSHEMKYHIKRTPKKNKSSMKSPTVRSPGGPNAVLSTNFRLVGVVNINIKNFDKKCFRFENFDFNCPLEGTLNLKSSITVRHPFEKSGFFDVRDTKGFWNMRWTVLDGTRLGFWRFPEDPQKTSALSMVDLKNCINPKVSLIPTHLRQICARRNTIALILIEKSSPNILTKESSIPRSRYIKLLISGENKENCIEWSEYMTRVLSNIRLWESDAVKPYSPEDYEKLLISLQ